MSAFLPWTERAEIERKRRKVERRIHSRWCLGIREQSCRIFA
jgi:hypothetical protein